MSDLLYKTLNGVAYLTMNRPEVRNALSPEMIQLMLDALQRCEADEDVRCVVLQGAGGHFLAGGDVKSFLELSSQPPGERRDTLSSRIHGSFNRLVHTLQKLDKPVIASVQGGAAGGGVSLALACDLVLVSEDAFFTLAYSKIGSSPDGGITWNLPRLVGVKKAMELALLGDRFTATEALEMGLVNRLVPASKLATETRVLAERLARGPTRALVNTKRLILRSSVCSLEEQLHAEAETFGQTAMTEDWVEGVTAFNEKRTAQFSGN